MPDEEISNGILELAKTRGPETVQKLIELAEQELGVPKDIALKQVIELQNQGRLRLSSLPKPIPKNLNAYIFSSNAMWFWVIMILSISTTITVFTIPEKAIPYVYIRYMLGSIFLLLLPGYSLVKTLFPTKEIDNIERIALSMGVSLALVPLVGLLLNYTPWGIRLTPVILSLLALTIFFTIVGLKREYDKKT